MSKLGILIKGELSRLTKYNVTTVSFIVAVVWFLLLFFLDDQDLLMQMLPFVIVIDATMMSVIFIGSVMFFEKTESTFSTMLVTPVTNEELILSKAIANTIHSMFSSLLVMLVFLVKNVEINWLFIIPGLALAIFMHSLLGFVFSFHAKDFTSLLVNVMIYSFILTIPVMLHYFGLILKADIWDTLLLIIPTQASIKIIEAGFGGAFDFKVYVSIVVLILYASLGYFFYVKPKFKTYAVKQSGV